MSLSPGAQKIRDKYPWLNTIAEKNRKERESNPYNIQIKPGILNNQVTLNINVPIPQEWITINFTINEDGTVSNVNHNGVNHKLKAIWTMETAEDLKNFHNIDASAELTAILDEEIKKELGNT